MKYCTDDFSPRSREHSQKNSRLYSVPQRLLRCLKYQKQQIEKYTIIQLHDALGTMAMSFYNTTPLQDIGCVS